MVNLVIDSPKTQSKFDWKSRNLLISLFRCSHRRTLIGLETFRIDREQPMMAVEDEATRSGGRKEGYL
ncbi:hypothetical protein ES332_A06G124300v1 [Gossypium tomentosum]|uniref:Uncharacterized protein n=1 Tax=Gossypium tomentosum TaxID=34277 RepID=A0A5D2Q687_GOSTO|nr:hypothetical protein ES332_A06G124300v1 [Gossypium tomentosum]